KHPNRLHGPTYQGPKVVAQRVLFYSDDVHLVFFFKDLNLSLIIQLDQQDAAELKVKQSLRYCRDNSDTFHLMLMRLQLLLVFCPKYGRKILAGDIEKDLRQIFYDIAKEKDVEIKALEIMPGHVHMFISFDPRQHL